MINWAVPFSSKATTASTSSTNTDTLPVAPGIAISIATSAPASTSLGTVTLTWVSNFSTVKSVEFSVGLYFKSPLKKTPTVYLLADKSEILICPLPSITSTSYFLPLSITSTVPSTGSLNLMLTIASWPTVISSTSTINTDSNG